MRVQALQSIAVVGPLKMGKATICRLLGEKRVSRKGTPPRYAITVEGFPRLQRYVLAIYRKLDHINLEMSERIGMIVLTPEKMNSLCEKHRFRKHAQFFEILRKLYWLGVKHYVVVVTHMDQGVQNDMLWFERTTQQFSSILRTELNLRVTAAVPFGRSDLHEWYNVFRTEPWYAGPCLVQALHDLTIALPSKRSRSLWAVGHAIPTKDPHTIWFKTESPCRGTFSDKATVKIFLDTPETPDQLSGTLGVETDKLAVTLQNGTLHQMTAAVIASTSLTPQYPTVLKVDAVLKKGIAPAELNNMDLDVVFFGPHAREGQIFVSTHSWGTHYGAALHPDLGNRLPLRVHMLRRPVVEIFGKDPDAGRVLLFHREPVKTARNLLAVGRIVAFFEYETIHFVKVLMFIDQLQYTSSHERCFLTRELEHLIHDTKHDAEMLQLRESGQPIDNTHRIEKIHRIIGHLVGRLKSLSYQPLFKEHGHLVDIVIRWLEEIKQNLIHAFGELDAELDTDVHNQKLRQIAKYYGDMKETINRQTTRPIRKLAQEMITAFELQQADFVYNIHDQLSQYIDYYPKEPLFFYEELHRGELSQSIEEAIRDGLEELLSNSVRYSEASTPGHSGRIDIFIDPPSVQAQPEVKIWLQDTGLLTEQKLQAILTSTRGWNDHKRCLERYNIRLDVSNRLGFGTTCVLRIPIWDIAPDMRQYILYLAALLTEIDREQQQQTGACPDYLGRLTTIMSSSDSINTMTSAIEALVVDQLSYVLRSQPHEYIEQMKILLHRLQKHPIAHLIRDVQYNIWIYLQKKIHAFMTVPAKEDLIRVTQRAMPAYRLRHPSLYRVLRKTMAWGVKELICSGAGITRTNQMLIPFRTRLAHLDFENTLTGDEYGEFLVISIPVWIIQDRRR
jgi:hypothetical protein